jgi:hypothetical protein
MTDDTRSNDNKFSDHVWDWRNTAVDKVLGLLPRRTAEHFVNAQKEGILAVRSLLDRGIEALDNDLKRVNERPVRDR